MRKLVKKMILAFGNVKLPIVSGSLRGCWWILGSSEGNYGGVSVLLGRSESEQLRVGKGLVKKNDVCFDLGANVGIYSLLFSKFGGRVFAFEPVPRNISFLYRNLRINNRENVVICPFAVGNKSGLVSFRVDNNWATGRLGGSGEPVACIKLDDFCDKTGVYPKLMKIDVEGAEYEVLEGAKKILCKHKPILMISFHGDENRNVCLKYLRDLGYKNIASVEKNETGEDLGYEYIIKK